MGDNKKKKLTVAVKLSVVVEKNISYDGESQTNNITDNYTENWSAVEV